MSMREPGEALPALTASASELMRMLQVIEDEILPKTRLGVAAGNKASAYPWPVHSRVPHVQARIAMTSS